MRKSIGYFGGTDCNLLTALVCAGHDTIPVSNGRDNHGQHVRMINDQNRYDLLIGHVHKIFAPESRLPSDATYQDIFHLCRTYSIPFLVAVPESLHEQARELLEYPPDVVRLVDPADMELVAKEILSG